MTDFLIFTDSQPKSRSHVKVGYWKCKWRVLVFLE